MHGHVGRSAGSTSDDASVHFTTVHVLTTFQRSVPYFPYFYMHTSSILCGSVPRFSSSVQRQKVMAKFTCVQRKRQNSAYTETF